MSGVFINYRTGDGDWAARLTAQELAARFGPDQVFYAARSIPLGDDFAKEIHQRLVNSDVLLALVGRQWLTAVDGLGNRRLDNPDDWVRREIRTAFAHRLRVIPVLLDGVPRLPEGDLPDDIAALARRQYLRLDHRDNDRDIARLIDELTGLLPSGTCERWRVRIRDTTGAVLGAGVLLADKHVLTCAHTVGNTGDEVIVDFVGLGYAPSMKARTVPEWCVRPQQDQRGDVALLQLDRSQTNAVGATLRREALSWERAVHVCGFPSGLEDGTYTRAILTGYGDPGGEWLQLSARSPTEQRIRSGFGGAGVVDDKTGHVLGIVVCEYTGQAASRSWMIPVETIVNHLPRVAEWVTGDSAADEVFGRSTGSGVTRDDLARTFADWLARRDTGDCLMIVVGPDFAVMHRAVGLSSREQRTSAPDPPEGTVPALGSIDLALDASGKTLDEVARRILNRAGIPLDDTVSAAEQVRSGIPPMTIVVDGVDDAQQPAALLNEVLKPLAERGSRLALGFRKESSPSLALARSWDLSSADRRLERLAERIETLEITERRLRSLRAHIAGQVLVASRAAGLGVALSALRRIAADSDPETTRQSLERCEQKAAQALRQAMKAVVQLEESLAERGSLRGRLEAYQAKANDDGRDEDIGLAAVYRRARELLWRSPTDLPAARAAVRDYLLAIRRAPGDEPEKGQQ